MDNLTALFQCGILKSMNKTSALMKTSIRPILALCFIALVSSTSKGDWPRDIPTFVPPVGYVPNAETAVAIAQAVWLPIYG